ncbi:hypothetical protein [Microbacterium luticocti]|uniref:hypothetical protein n=1 Tax=Microbacterium luticocti TaxID=451764 RepID=UPI00048E6C8B|nr:hypothetical protein [Microbacterium luticocti]
MSDEVLAVRYREPGRTTTEQTLQRLVRKQGILQLILAVLLGLMGPGAVLAATILAGDLSARVILLIIALLVIPVALCVLAVRQLRRQVRLPELAVTITADAVRFPAVDRASALFPRIRAEEWVRDGTSAAIIPASGLNSARVVFTRQDDGKRRRRTIAADNLAIDPRIIVDALGSPHSA